jgi:predicted DNA-binding transcriptional regulator AlpA
MRALSTRPRFITVSTDARYLSISQVRERYGVSAMWIWRHMRDRGFPKPVKFGGPTSARHWRVVDVEQWERERALQNGRGTPPQEEKDHV